MYLLITWLKMKWSSQTSYYIKSVVTTYPERGKRIILVVVSAAALIAGCVCLICDYFYFGQIIVVIDCCCFNYSCMAYVASKSDFQNKDRFENLSCSQCYPFSATGNIVFAFEKVSYIHVGRLHNADCDCCNLDNVYNFPQVQKKLVAGIWLCPAGFNTQYRLQLLILQLVFYRKSSLILHLTYSTAGSLLALSLVCFGVDYLLYHRKGGCNREKMKQFFYTDWDKP